MKNYYCENCLAENIKKYIKDDIGGIFCNEKCLKDFAYENEHKISERSK